MKPVTFRRIDSGPLVPPYALLRRTEDFGMEELDLLRPPARFWSDGEPTPDGAQMHVDARRLRGIVSPAALLAEPPVDNWMAMSRRSLARLHAWFLLVEDPQRRLEAQPIVTLAHQASVVQHIASQPFLQRVLLADEVGLGKTVEAGLLIKHVLEQKPGARVLYLAPARLVRNVRSELDRLGLGFRSWVASSDRDATLKDPRVVASIHRAAYQGRIDEVISAPPWDMIIADECHHLSDWAPGGGKPVAQFKLVEKLAQKLAADGRLLLMSGTPHQGHPDRFKNLLRLLRRDGEREDVLAGRVIYRTKEDVQDWDGRPLFPKRQVNAPLVVDVGDDHQEWLGRILDFFEPAKARSRARGSQRRAAGWRASQALQWATSSVQAGLGYLVRQAVRARITRERLPILDEALTAMRPYRMGSHDEPLSSLFARISREVQKQLEDADVEDIEEDGDDDRWKPDIVALAALLDEGVGILRGAPDKKWELVWDRVLKPAGREKVVLFAQPIETVTTVADFIERKTGKRPAMIIGNQSEEERSREVATFWEPSGPQFLVSSRAGGEGLNLQVARRLVHLDVPWNPMELEQRIGRVHRFKSRKTILVDTVVVKDSREVDTYAFARQKLRDIASMLVPEDRFESLFGRVMALVPPEELQDVLAQGPVGPLSDEDRKKLSELVTRGFEQWKSFHERYSSQQGEIRALDPGDATWDDLASFARIHLQAAPAEDFSALRFAWDAGEVRDLEERANVLLVGGKAFACGDYGGMPVTRADGATAERLGTNVGPMTRALRAAAFTDTATGAAHVRWPEESARPVEGVFGVVIFVRQSVRWEGGAYVEQATTLHCSVVDSKGDATHVAGKDRGPLVRALLDSTVRRDPHDDATLVEAIGSVQTDQLNALRRPSDEDRQLGVVHAVTPLFAVIVG
jgi:superfamily II DNA or RNA helicase